jgi:glycyl-tRNA synthetase beta chain
MVQFFFEIYQEEIPARMQVAATEQLKELLEKILAELTIEYQTIQTMVTPLRLIGFVDGIADKSKESITRIRGPKETAPETIIEKFKNCHTSPETGFPGVTFTGFDGYIYAEKIIPPAPTSQLIPQLTDHILTNLSWQKSMRWPGSSIEWVRPIRRVYCQFDMHPLIFDLPLIGITTSDHVIGHRFMSPHKLQPASFDNYLELLGQNNVMPDHQKRQQYVHEQLTGLGNYLVDEDLIEENAGLAEWPIVYRGNIDQQFLTLPEEVLYTTMKVHQRYFSYPGKPIFGVVANATPEDGSAMVAGYERVLRARLSDAQFFYEQDCTKKLEDFTRQLTTIVFHKSIGSLADKTARLEAFMDTPDGKTAARFCKADLATSVVYEFPELQGTMGRIYGEKQGLPVNICTALEQHHWPLGAERPLPTTVLAAELSFADKLDTLLGLLGTGIKVSSSKDPLGLRRLAIGVIRLIQTFGFDFDSVCKRLQINLPITDDALTIVSTFLKDRAEVYFNTPLIRGLTHLPVTTMIQRLPLIQNFVQSETGTAFLAQYKRLCGLLKPHEKSPPALQHPFEIILNDWNIKHVELTDINVLSELITPMQDYFDQVKVLDGTSEAVNGRLTLLSTFKDTVEQFYCFSG